MNLKQLLLDLHVLFREDCNEIPEELYKKILVPLLSTVILEKSINAPIGTFSIGRFSKNLIRCCLSKLTKS